MQNFISNKCLFIVHNVKRYDRIKVPNFCFCTGIHLRQHFMPITSFIFSMSSIVSGTSAFIVSGKKKYGIAASTVKRPIATLGKTLSISPNKSTIKGAKAAPILELASRKQNAAFLVEVGKSSGE